MSLLVVGLSHRSAPVSLIERASVASQDTRKVLSELLSLDNVSEAMLLSTCNRVEVYAVVSTFHGGLADISGTVERNTGIRLDELTDHLYVHYAAAGVEHLFRVISGLDSMVVGEPQILGQVRSAYAQAEQARTVGRTLHELSQQALRVGKRVHSETGIDAAGASVVSEALADAAVALTTDGAVPGLVGRRALVVGAGSMGALTASRLRRADVGEIVVANRSLAKAARLAATNELEGTPSRAVGMADVVSMIPEVDLLVCCTGAPGSVLSAVAVQASRAGAAAKKPLVVCDLGLPRDVEAEVGDLPGVTLVDLTSLQRRLEATSHGLDTRAAHLIVADEVRAYLAVQRSAEVTPTVTALRKRAAEVVDAELLRLDGRLPELDTDIRGELAQTVRRVVDKLLHTPTVRVKQLAETGGGETYADALRELFGLDPSTAEAVTATLHTSVPDTAGESDPGASR